jgi:hypothetical protein
LSFGLELAISLLWIVSSLGALLFSLSEYA